MQDSVANCFQTSCQWLRLSGPRRETSRVHGVLDVKQLSLEFIFLFVLRHLSRLESFGLFEAELGNFEMDILTDQRMSKTLDSKISEMWFIFLYWCIEYLLIYEWFIVICQYLRDTTNMRTSKYLNLSLFKEYLLVPIFWFSSLLKLECVCRASAFVSLVLACDITFTRSALVPENAMVPLSAAGLGAGIWGFTVSQEVFRVDSRFGGESYLYCGNILFNILN